MRWNRPARDWTDLLLMCCVSRTFVVKLCESLCMRSVWTLTSCWPKCLLWFCPVSSLVTAHENTEQNQIWRSQSWLSLSDTEHLVICGYIIAVLLSYHFSAWLGADSRSTETLTRGSQLSVKCLLFINLDVVMNWKFKYVRSVHRNK